MGISPVLISRWGICLLMHDPSAAYSRKVKQANRKNGIK